MPQALVAGLVVAHGLITTMIGLGGVTKPDAPAVTLPAWFGWWPGPFGRSWLIDALDLGSGAWLPLAFGGAAAGLVALALFFHPLYVVAVVINVALVVLASGALVPEAR